nr:hypothetical protein GCM10025730_32820 [Promicromonospora thailandica]
MASAIFLALICSGVVGDGDADGDRGAEGLPEAGAVADSDADDPGPGIAPCTVSGSSTPDRTTANPPIARTAIPMRTAIVRVGVMADETI